MSSPRARAFVRALAFFFLHISGSAATVKCDSPSFSHHFLLLILSSRSGLQSEGRAGGGLETRLTVR